MIYIKIPDKIVNQAEKHVKKTAENVKNKIGEKISETVENINAEISSRETERKRKNLEIMNQIRFNSRVSAILCKLTRVSAILCKLTITWLAGAIGHRTYTKLFTLSLIHII